MNNKKKSIIASISRIVCLALILATVGTGCGENKEEANINVEKDRDLYKLLEQSEEAIAEYFGVDVNDDGMYPNSNALSVICEDGKCTWVDLSDGLDDYKNYTFAGNKVGDDKEKVLTVLEKKKFNLLGNSIRDNNEYYYYSSEKGYSLTVLFEDGNARTFLYLAEAPDEELVSELKNGSGDTQEAPLPEDSEGGNVASTEEVPSDSETQAEDELIFGRPKECYTNTNVVYGGFMNYIIGNGYVEAYVSFSTGYDYEYITLAYYSVNDREQFYLAGILGTNEYGDRTAYVYDEEYGYYANIKVSFWEDEFGYYMKIEVVDDNTDEVEVIDGWYICTDLLNLDEVG